MRATRAEGRRPSGDPVDRLVFSFYEHRLFRIVVDYAPDRTDGMTESDMVGAVSTLYGSPIRRTLASQSDGMAPAGPAETLIAEWTSGDQSVALLALQGQTAFRLIVVSSALQRLAREAGAREAPVDRPDWPSHRGGPDPRHPARRRASAAEHAARQRRVVRPMTGNQTVPPSG